MKKSTKYIVSIFVATFILLFTNSAVIHSKEFQLDYNLMSVKTPCCDHGCQASLMDEEEAEDAEDEEQDDKDTTSMEFDDVTAE